MIKHLTNEQAQEIINKYINGIENYDLAKEYKVTSRVINDIIKGNNFKNCRRPNDIIEIFNSRKRKKLGQVEAQEIINIFMKGTKTSDIANQYNVNNRVIADIIIGKSFKECERSNNIKKLYEDKKRKILDEDQAQSIINDFITGYEISELVEKYNINSVKINNILLARTFKNCNRPLNIQDIIDDRNRNFTATQAQTIIDRFLNGEQCSSIAKEYNVPNDIINSIIKGKTFKKCKRPDNIKEIYNDRKSNIKIKQHQAQEIIDKYISGMGSIFLAKEYNICRRQVVEIVKGNCFENCIRPDNIKDIIWRKLGSPKIDEVQAQEIINRYVNGEKSVSLSKEYGVCRLVITEIVTGNKFENCIRPDNIKERLRRKNTGVLIDNLQLSNEQLQIFTGSMLGDGSICRSHKTFTLVQCKRRKDYVDDVRNRMKPFSSNLYSAYSTKKIVHGENGEFLYEKVESYLKSFSFKSYTHDFFKQQRDVFYPNGIKIVPLNLELSPLALAHWAVQDGCNLTGRRQYLFCTNGFSFESVELLVDKLNQTFDIKSVISSSSRNQPVINIYGYSYDKLIDIIAPHITWDCFQYKIERREVAFKPLQEDNVKKILDLWNCGFNVYEIEKETNIPVYVINPILKGMTYIHWQIYNKNPKQKIRDSSWNGVEIKCLETGDVFDSYAEASRKLKINVKKIRKSVIDQETCCGFHLEKNNENYNNDDFLTEVKL